ncbi:MAG: spore germination protein GerW family protein [Vicinamibacterales bacterium]
MSSPAPFTSIAEVIERGVSIRHVYGEAVHHGDTTVIPVASVAYGFGAGGGRRPGPMTDPSARPDAEGAGGGGGVRMTPAGVLEIGPHGTRFIHFHSLARLFGIGAMGLAIGWVLGRRR